MPFCRKWQTRWVDGQYALNALGLSNWENGISVGSTILSEVQCIQRD